MRFFNKMVFLIFCSTFLNFSVNAEEKKWNDVAYFKRQDIKMRLIKHEPPLVLEWGKLTNGKELPSKLKPLAVQSYYTLMNIDYNEWKTYFTPAYIKNARMTKETFEKNKKRNMKDYPNRRFNSILYEVDYMIAGKEYSMVVISRGPEKVTKWSKDKASALASLLIKEDGKWKVGDLDFKNLPYDGLKNFTNFNLLEKIIKTGFVYKSNKHGSVWPFEPSEILKTDSTSSK